MARHAWWQLQRSRPAPSGAKLTFRRVFKEVTGVIEITVREDSDTAGYEIGSWTRIRLIALSGECGVAHKDVRSGGAIKIFPGQDLDVHRKIANLGEKTFRWESAPSP